MPFSSSFIVPWFEVDGVPRPVPVEIGYDPALAEGVFGFETQNFHSVSHRNWMSCSWDATGIARAYWNVGGYTAIPGPVTVDNPAIHDDVEGFIQAEWELELPPATRIMPDFSLSSNARVIPEWGNTQASGFHPIIKTIYVEGVYPVFWDQNGVNQTGWYLEGTFRLFAEMTPYRWRHNNTYYCEQLVRVDFAFRGVPSPGAEPTAGWNMAEFTAMGMEGGATSRKLGDTVCGQVQIIDQTTGDPTQWSSMNFWGNQSTNITLHIRRNFLPREPY